MYTTPYFGNRLCACFGALALLLSLAACKAAADARAAAAPVAAAAACIAASPSAASCSWRTQDSPKSCAGLCIGGNVPLEVADDGTASATLQLCNRSGAAIKPALAMTTFEQVTGETRTPLTAAVRLRAASAADDGIVQGSAELAPEACVGLTIEAARLREAGLMVATLRHGRDDLAEIKALRERPPFRLKADGATPDKIALGFVHHPEGSTARIILRNEDLLTYRFHWRLELGGAVVDEGTATAYPGRLVEWPVRLPASNFSKAETALIRVGEQRGRLLLTHEPDPSFRVRAVAERSFDVTARLSWFSPVLQGIVNSFVITLLLVVGIGLSLLVNHALPVQRKRIALKQRLAELEGKLAGLGGTVSSRRLNLLRTDKKRLRDELRANQWFYPSTDDALPKLATRIERLGQRIALTVEAGAQLSGLRDDASIALPEAERVEQHCRAALDVAEQQEPDEAALKAARAALDAAASIRSASDQVPSKDAVTALLAQAGQLRQATLPTTAALAAVVTLLEVLRSELLGTAETAVTRERYVDASNAARKTQLLLAFADLVGAPGDPALQAQRAGRAGELLAALRPGADASVRRAGDIVSEVRQNVDKAALLAEVARPGAAYIEFDPRTPVPYQLAVFRVRLGRPGFDTALARRQISCRWRVSGPGIDASHENDPDESWVIGRFFEPPTEPGLPRRLWAWLRRSPAPPPPAPYQVEATLRADRDSQATLVTVAAQLRLESVKSYGWDIAMLTAGTTFVTICLVVVGLVSGAEEKIRSLDWWSAMIAVVVIGFSADALKRVLTKP